MISVIDEWREIGNWWDGRSETRFFVVLVDNGGIYELSCDCDEHEAWHLTRIFD